MVFLGFCFLVLCSLLNAQERPTNSTELTPGQPRPDTVANDEYDYYYITLASHTQPLTITCTPIGDGDPDLYVSLQYDHPDPTRSEYTANSYGQDAVTIPPDAYRGKSYAYISVYGWRTAQYTITASFESAVTLINGVPQAGQVPHEGTDYFEYHANHTTNITVTVVPLSGDLLVYISGTQPPEHDKPATWSWSSGPHYQGEAIVIPATDPAFPKDTLTFYIGVYGGTNATYRVIAVEGTTAITLSSGVPQSDHCETGESEYFSIVVNNPDCSLSVTLTPITGDPDLYMSTTNPQPNATNNQWSSNKSGADQININPAPPATYYISAFAWRNSSFTILAFVNCSSGPNRDIMLVDGAAQQVFLAAGELQYFTFYVSPDHEDVSFSLTRRFGDPDLFVQKGGRASPTNYTWKADAYGDDLLTIHVDDPAFCEGCTLYVTVYAHENQNTSFTITASLTDHHVRLQEGIPFREDLTKSHYEYFRFDVEAVTQELTVTVTSLGNGDPDLYIGIGNNTFPNNTHYDWAAQRLYGDSITIPHTDPKACQFCTYWISVYAFSNTTFTIVASFDGAVRLQDSVPQNGHVLRGAMVYFDFQTANNNDVFITLTTINGSSALFANTGDAYPTPSQYQYSQPYYNQIKTILIPATDPNACHSPSCYYRIGVQGIEDGDFSILAYTGYSTINLVPGVSQRTTVPQGGWAYFLTRVDEAGFDLSVLVTPLSGDPDIYISTTVERPNSTVGFYDKKATRYGGDTIDYENAAVGTYYIGVNAYTNSTFNILALLDKDNVTCNDLSCTITLFDGQPQEGQIHQSHYVYYTFIVSAGKTSVTFTLSKEYGDPDMYISADGSFPNSTHKQWASTSIQSDVIEIQSPTPGRYIIGIYAYQTSAYTMLASTGNGNCSSSLIQLQNGAPLRGECSANQYLYYTTTIDIPNVDLTITVTPFSGDPDLYVSTSICPNTNSSMWEAKAYRDDSITISTTDPHYCRCQYYVSVFCFSASSFSIVSSFTQTQTLADGVPQSGTVAVEAWQYYIVRVVNDSTELTISLTPRDGNPDLYIQTNTKPTLTNSSWNATDPYTSSTVVIRSSDPKFCGNCVYYVGVYGRTAANYTVSASTGTDSTTLVLQAGVSQRQWVDTNSYLYFSFDVPTPNQDVTIIITPLTGDPDLYVSHSTTRPTTTNYEYSSRASGADAVAINNWPNATTWYIGVYAYLNSTFTITAYVHCEVCPPITLVNGIPQNGILNGGLYQYYRFFLSPESTDSYTVLYISVTRTVGDPDIYVRNDGYMPTRDNKTWSSTSFGEDIITITNPVPTEYDIGIYAYTTSQYTIRAYTGNTSQTLSDGVPVQGTIAQGDFQYFQINVDRLDADLTVTVTSFNGDPDLFISDSNPRPNSTSATWSARSPREDSITIPMSTLKLQTYYIAVQGWTNVSFTITASFRNEILLQSGVPQGGVVAAEATNYYRFTVGPNKTDIYVSLTSYSGSAYLLVSNSTQPVLRNTTTYQWASQNPGSQYLKIGADDPSACVSCTYYIAAYGATSTSSGGNGSLNANYTIVASTNGTVLVLQDGIAQRAWVNAGEYAYFVFNLNVEKADLQIAITPISGDPDLYISTINEKPSASNYTWKSIASGADAINIDYLDPNFKLGAYYIGGFAWGQASTFTIIATVIDLNNATSCDDPNTCAYSVLQDGLPQVGFLNQSGDRLYYEFYVGNEGSVTFTVTPKYGDPDMYIRNDTIPPNASNAMWSARSYGRDSITITDGCRNCRYLILIQAYSHTLYSLVATTDLMPTLLQNGIPLSLSLESYQWSYYYTLITSYSSDPLIIAITAFSGDPDLYVSNTSTHPNTTDYIWRAAAQGSDQVVIPNPVPGSYYIGVYAYHNTTFSLVATNGPISLVNGQPHNDQLDVNQYRDYQIFVSDTNHSELVISLNVNQGDPLLFVGTLTNGTRPNPNEPWTYNYTTANAASSQRYVITVPSNDAHACYQCTYFIRVFTNTSLSSFAITATYGSSSIVILIAGKPTYSMVGADRYTYFRAIIDSPSYDINIAATTFTGDIDLFVSNTNPFPNKADPLSYNWSSIHDPTARGDSISISHETPGFTTGYYYIGVYGWESSSFTITLAANETLLSPGTPQVGLLDSDGEAYFFFDVDAATDVTLTISPFNDSSTGGSYGVYVATDIYMTQPNATNNDWSSTVIEGGSFFIQRNCTKCTYYVGVFGVPARKFTLSASLEYTSDNLFNGRPYSGKVSSGGLKYFQIFVPNASSFSVSVETCAGNADLYMAQDSYKPDPDHFRYVSDHDDENDHVEVHDPSIVNSEFYISVYGAADGVNTEYIITTNTVPVTSTAPAIRGGAIYITPSSGALDIQFNQATSNITSPEMLTYTIYWATQNSPFVMYSACGLAKVPNAQRTSFTWRDSNVLLISKSISGLLKDTTYKVNVVVTDGKGASTLYVTASARTTDADAPTNVSLGLLLGILLPVSAVILAAMLYLIVRNRKLTKELNFEMHDIPKAALDKAAAGPKNYDKLLNEDDEETGGGPSANYAPPSSQPPAGAVNETIQAL